jgi:hypothetical protein
MTERGQASLPVLAVALLTLTATGLLAVTVAGGALAAADRPAEERRTAVAAAERMVAPDSPLTDRANVLDAAALTAFDDDALAESFPVTQDAQVAMAVDGEVYAGSDDAAGPTVRRLVHVLETEERTVEPSFGTAAAVTLPRRSGRIEVALDPAPDTRIETVRVNERVVLHDPEGLRGEFTLSLSRRETSRLAFEANRSLSEGSVSLTFPLERTRKATLSVTVDA